MLFRTLILASILMGCSATEPRIVPRIEIIEVPVRVYVAIPEELLKPCRVPIFPRDKELTYGDVVAYSIGVIGTVESCNKQLAELRKLQSEARSADGSAGT